eukprot:UN3542
MPDHGPPSLRHLSLNPPQPVRQPWGPGGAPRTISKRPCKCIERADTGVRRRHMAASLCWQTTNSYTRISPTLRGCPCLSDSQGP